MAVGATFQDSQGSDPIGAIQSYMQRAQSYRNVKEDQDMQRKLAAQDEVMRPLLMAKQQADLASSILDYQSAVDMQRSETEMAPLVANASKEFNQIMTLTDPDAKANAALEFSGRYAQFKNTKKWGPQFDAYNKIATELYTENKAISRLRETERLKSMGPDSPIGKMLSDYDKARATGNTQAADFILAGIKEEVTPKGMILEVGSDGGIKLSQGSSGLTTPNTTKSQERQYQQERLIREGAQLFNILRPEDLGVQGSVGEVAGGFLGQINPDLANAQVAENRTKLRSFRESALRAVSDDSRFSEGDRKAIAGMLPSDGWAENLPQARGKLKAVLTIFAQRASNEAKRQGGQSWTDLPPEEIIKSAREGKIDKDAAAAILDTLHSDWVKKQSAER